MGTSPHRRARARPRPCFQGLGTALGRIACVWLLGTFAAAAQDQSPSEYQVKAAFLYNFAKFVEWPTNVFPEPATPIVIGVFGENPFGHDLETIVAGKTVNGRTLEVRLIKNPAEARRCHILFIAGDERRRRPDLARALQGASVLTVSEADRPGPGDGVMIDLFMERKRVLFYIDSEAAQHAGLKISPRLLKLSRRRTSE